MTEQEWPAFNVRRGELIDRKITGTITESESIELAIAQKTCEDFLDEQYPTDTTLLESIESKMRADVGRQS
jgi:hypothetical protein